MDARSEQEAPSDWQHSQAGALQLRVLVLSDVRLVREGLVSALGQSGLAPFAVATHAALLEALAAARWDVVLLDMATGPGREVVRAVHAVTPGQCVVAFAAVEDEQDVLASIEAGVTAFVPRQASIEELCEVLARAVRGEAVLSPHLQGSLIRRLATLALTGGTSHRGAAGDPPARLTIRERDVLALVDEGMSNKAIAAQLGIEVATVKNHVHNILDKLHASRRGEAAARARSAVQRLFGR